MSNLVVGCRQIELLYRQRAVSDRALSWKWLGEADRWSDLAHREIASRFQNNEMHAGPMVQWQWDQTPLKAIRTNRSTS
jgi:hypothetical protein